MCPSCICSGWLPCLLPLPATVHHLRFLCFYRVCDAAYLQGSTLNHWPFPWNHLHEGYAYILTHPGTPCVFYDHYWQQHGQLGTSVHDLLRIRKICGIHSRSKVVIRRATADCYAALIDDKLAMKMGHGDWSPNQDTTSNGSFRWQLVVSGPKFAVWAEPSCAEKVL